MRRFEGAFAGSLSLIVLSSCLAATFTETRTSASSAVTTAQGADAAPGQPPGAAAPRDRNNQRIKKGTATVRGRVTAADTGQPLRKARVRITRADANGPELPRVANTDAGGRYQFKDLVAGRYELTASKGSYVSLQFGQRRPFEQGKPLQLLDGQTVERVDFSLPRGGVIAGRVLDELGEPATEVNVSLLRPQFDPYGHRRLTATFGGTTNDLGEFRIFAVPPGDYYVAATLRNEFGDADDGAGYAPTYYPGTPDLSAAERLTVAVGQTLAGISMTLLPIRTASVSGTAVDSRGEPMRGVVLVAQPRAKMSGVQLSGLSFLQPDGSFAISGLTPGTYMVTARGEAFFGASDLEFASAEITISGTDVTDVRLVAKAARVATGRVTVTEPGTVTAVRPSTLRVIAAPVFEDGTHFSVGSGDRLPTVNDDWTFQLKVPPGRARIELIGEPPGWSVKAIRYRGRDVADSGLDAADEDLTGIEIELTNRITIVSGLVTDERGAPMTDYWVVVFPQDKEQREAPSRRIHTARADQDGRFKMSGLPSGEYQAVAIDVLESGEANDPEFLSRVEPRATPFSLADGDTKALNLRLISIQ